VQVPHPRFRERRFVLEPLASIAPEMIDPVTGLTVAQLLARLNDADGAP
jgi:2-amino-4-hydroxy-6-hydroxymethyldihydropteridine diphosphokinase